MMFSFFLYYTVNHRFIGRVIFFIKVIYMQLQNLLPALLIMTPALLIPAEKMRQSGVSVASRPPPYVFSIVWTTIVAILTYDLWKSTNMTRNYLILGVSLLCGLWNVVYFWNSQKKLALAVMFFILMGVIMLNNHTYENEKTFLQKNKHILFLTWILTAFSLSMAEINQQS